MRRWLVAGCVFLCPAFAGAVSPWTVVAWNDLGMHCMDSEYAVFSILPPFNNIHAQVMDASGKLVTNPAGITVTYEAVADPDGSINSTSIGKTTFWDHVKALFGVALDPDMGLAGSKMPGAANTPQPLSFDPRQNWFIASGVPITPYDDAGNKNTYPLMRVVVRDAAGTLLAATNIVTPISDEMDCRACHGSGAGLAAQPAAGWVNDADPIRDYKLNILRLHDERQPDAGQYQQALSAAGYDGAGLYATVVTDGTSVLCARCHASNALATTGVAGVPPLTTSVHGFHAGVTDPESGQTLEDQGNRDACYRCHPGSQTRCLRGAMGSAVNPDGTMQIECQSCHGPMSAVGAAGRQGWLDEPNCQGCHSGTATKNRGQIRYTSVFDDTGAMRLPADPTFATSPDTPAAGISLYRFSSGHGGLQCEACHGSTHAEFATTERNDNLQSIALQGYAGKLAECAACHPAQPSNLMGGPHGMHVIGQAWVTAHQRQVNSVGLATCQSCHGVDYRGTVLSGSQADRTFAVEGGSRAFAKGTQIGCYSCHNGPRGG